MGELRDSDLRVRILRPLRDKARQLFERGKCPSRFGPRGGVVRTTLPLQRKPTPQEGFVVSSGRSRKTYVETFSTPSERSLRQGFPDFFVQCLTQNLERTVMARCATFLRLVACCRRKPGFMKRLESLPDRDRDATLRRCFQQTDAKLKVGCDSCA